MASANVIKSASLDPLSLQIHCTVSKKEHFQAKIVSMDDFLKQLRFANEHIKILYVQDLALNNSGAERQRIRSLIEAFESKYHDLLDWQHDDRRNKFEFHCAFYFYYYISVLRSRSIDCFKMF